MPDDPEDADPGLARERTRLSWVRTSIAFAAVGTAMLKRQLIPGAIVLALTPLIWAIGTFASRAMRPEPQAAQLLTVTVAVIAVAVLAMVIALIGHSPVSLQQLLHG